MLSLAEELIILISTFLNNKEKTVLTSLTKSFTMFSKKFIYRDRIEAEKIIYVPYNNNFTYVEYTYRSGVLAVPSFVTHLYIDDFFNKPLYALPKSLKFISINPWFNNTIDIPASITHILIDDYSMWYNYNDIPYNVTHIMIEELRTCLKIFPDTVKYLFVNEANKNYLDLKKVSSVTKIIYFDNENYKCIENFIDSASQLE